MTKIKTDNPIVLNLDDELLSEKTIASMYFPNDFGRRELVTIHQRWADELGPPSKGIPDQKSDLQFALKWISENGLNEKIVQATRRGTVAGIYLGSVYAMSKFDYGPVSLGRAIHVAQAWSTKHTYRDGKKLTRDRKTIRDHFKEYATVSPLWAAYEFLKDDINFSDSKNLFKNEKQLHRFLGVAASILEYATNPDPLRPQKNNGPLLSADLSIQIDDRISPILPLSGEMPDLLTSILESYKYETRY